MELVGGVEQAVPPDLTGGFIPLPLAQTRVSSGQIPHTKPFRKHLHGILGVHQARYIEGPANILDKRERGPGRGDVAGKSDVGSQSEPEATVSDRK